MHEINEGDQANQDQNVTRRVVGSEEAALGIVSDFMKQPLPLIIFIEYEEQEYDAKLFKLAREHGVTFRAVSTYEQALEAQSGLKKSDTGVVRLARKYSRGFDLKFAKSANVVVIANNAAFGLRCFTHNDCLQMFARGCRVQGEQKGTIIFIDDQITDADQKWHSVVSRNFALRSDCVRNLKPLFKALPYLKQAGIQAVREAYKNKGWQTHMNSTFCSTYRSMLATLDKWTKEAEVEERPE